MISLNVKNLSLPLWSLNFGRPYTCTESMYMVAWTPKIENTLVHTHLVNFASDDYAAK
jgi:hypothetical protein